MAREAAGLTGPVVLESAVHHPSTAKSVTKAHARTERIYRAIRRRICLLDYSPGTVLREHDLAADFGVSRTPIRRALHWLERDGLVASRSGVGTTVTAIDVENLLDTYRVRAKLAESIGLTNTVTPSPSVLERLDQLYAQCDVLKLSFDMRRFGEINIDLHTQNPVDRW